MKLKEYFKLFSYIFYPGMVLILYLAQALEGHLSTSLIFCPTDIVVFGLILLGYFSLDHYHFFDKTAFAFFKRKDGRLKSGYLFVGIIILVFLMNLYDDLKVYFYLNLDVSVNLLIVIGVWLVVLLINYLINRETK